MIVNPPVPGYMLASLRWVEITLVLLARSLVVAHGNTLAGSPQLGTRNFSFLDSISVSPWGLCSPELLLLSQLRLFSLALLLESPVHLLRSRFNLVTWVLRVPAFQGYRNLPVGTGTTTRQCTNIVLGFSEGFGLLSLLVMHNWYSLWNLGFGTPVLVSGLFDCLLGFLFSNPRLGFVHFGRDTCWVCQRISCNRMSVNFNGNWILLSLFNL